MSPSADGLAPVVVTASPMSSPTPAFPGISGLMLGQSQNPPAQQPPQWPGYASRGNNPKVGRNIGVGALVGGLGVGVFAAVNIVGFPEVEVGEGIGVLLGGLSALGDPGLIMLNFGTYGATAGGIAGYVATPPQ
jgi:hypothetical protein